MSIPLREEVWLARIAFVFGAKELIDVVLNVVALVKSHADLGLALQGTSDDVTLAYLGASTLVSFYLLAGGKLFSRVAYGRTVPRQHLLGDIGLPDSNGWLTLAFHVLGIYQIIAGVAEAALAISVHDFVPMTNALHVTRASVAWTVAALERLAIGFLLLTYGAKLARFFVGTTKK